MAHAGQELGLGGLAFLSGDEAQLAVHVLADVAHKGDHAHGPAVRVALDAACGALPHQAIGFGAHAVGDVDRVVRLQGAGPLRHDVGNVVTLHQRPQTRIGDLFALRPAQARGDGTAEGVKVGRKVQRPDAAACRLQGGLEQLRVLAQRAEVFQHGDDVAVARAHGAGEHGRTVRGVELHAHAPRLGIRNQAAHAALDARERVRALRMRRTERVDELVRGRAHAKHVFHAHQGLVAAVGVGVATGRVEHAQAHIRRLGDRLHEARTHPVGHVADGQVRERTADAGLRRV